MQRKSGIELLKIFAIFIIVVSHVVQTVVEFNDFVPYSDYVLDITYSNTNLTLILLTLLQYCGTLGNSIFFICSAWFLLDKTVSDKKKIMHIIADVWCVSVIILISVLIAQKGNINFKLIIKSLLPTTFANNWYITCYILFCLLYPFLNKIINSLSKYGLLRVALFMGFIYLVINFLFSSFFSSPIIIWISIYFILAYIKKYHKDFTDSKKINALLIVFGLVCNTLTVLAMNFLGLKIGFLNDKVRHWISNCNPFIIMTAFGTFNLFRSLDFKNKFINGAAKLSLFAYIIHENILLRNYYRPALFHEIYIKFGYNYLFLWIFVISAIIFVAAMIISFIYSKTIRTLTGKLCDKIYIKFKASKLHKILYGEEEF